VRHWISIGRRTTENLDIGRSQSEARRRAGPSIAEPSGRVGSATYREDGLAARSEREANIYRFVVGNLKIDGVARDALKALGGDGEAVSVGRRKTTFQLPLSLREADGRVHEASWPNSVWEMAYESSACGFSEKITGAGVRLIHDLI